ncbi:peptidase S8/S53 domain-containing protein [Colletotrichum cereale]|nr:peptidase S8/S53 domain-containing protein [Colletotrichum cereale]
MNSVFSLQQYLVEVARVKDISRTKVLIPQSTPCLQKARLQFRHEFEFSLFPGLSLAIANGSAYGDYTHCLNSVEGVIKTWQLQSYLPAANKDVAAGPDITHSQPVNSSILHGLTGVRDLHEAGVAGQGVTIAMVDEGVDYLHPALGVGIGDGYKIGYGIDLVGDDWRVGGDPQPDQDPYTECTNHGTHISGIAAGKQLSLGFVGVAPEARLEHFRVSGCQRVPIDSDIIIKAVLMAHSRKVDVISLSLTLNTGPYPDDPLSEVLTRISQEGQVLIAVASGNYGWQGPLSAHPPASASDILAVGSVNSAYSVQSQPRASFLVTNTAEGESEPIDFTWAPAGPCHDFEHVGPRRRMLNLGERLAVF